MRDGGPAFPIANAVFDADAPDSFDQFKAATSQSQGMSLRDYFAAAVLTGLSANAAFMSAGSDESKRLGMTAEEYQATYCYTCADAMLAEREKS